VHSESVHTSNYWVLFKEISKMHVLAGKIKSVAGYMRALLSLCQGPMQYILLQGPMQILTDMLLQGPMQIRCTCWQARLRVCEDICESKRICNLFWQLTASYTSSLRPYTLVA
jgi:hypothetical protein